MQNKLVIFPTLIQVLLSSRCPMSRANRLSACAPEYFVRLLLLLLALLLGLFAPAQADELLLERGLSGVVINKRMAAATDDTARLPWSQILAEPQRFIPASGWSGAGLGSEAHWLRLDFRRTEVERGAPWWLVVEPLNLYDLRLYRRNAFGEFEELASGERVPFAAGREREWRQYAFILPEQGPVYLRAYDPAGASFPVALWHQDDLEDHEHLGELLLGSIYGALLAMCLYNLFLALSLRSQTYGWYVATTITLGIFLAHLHGHTAQWWWRDWPQWVAMGRIVLPSLWGLTLTGFIMSFFRTSTFLPSAHRLLQVIMLSYLLIITMRLAGLQALPSVVLTALSLPVAALVLYIAIRRWHQGMAAARYFLAAYTLLLASSVIFLLRSSGWLMPNPLTEVALPAAATFASLIFSLVLTGRIKSLRYESEAAFTDELTGLPNRRALEQRFKLYTESETDHGFSLLTVDLDKFKPVNDQWGHAEGDQVLRALAQRMQACVRQEDLVARVGGDEFVVLLSPSASPRIVTTVIKRLLEATHESVHVGTRSHSLSASVGLAHYPDHGRTLSELSRLADMAMYEAKRAGGDTWREV
ncbi:diguanylate cyclase [Nitrosomonas sp. Is37]|uniref:diguanylate cyclase n=1 Tax=Nitrosomonas sp. Is37 TaxID=3080535 RepID=UPI00294B1EFC|nr:diguanylate cyclase [Nitrosomonas sp. Is37]MDV6343966.1 diguanylate cyclase [Nitrosomonas sp. Is37]